MPTSITVVETSIEISFFKNLFKTSSLSVLSKAPWISPTLLGNFLLIISNFFLQMKSLKKKIHLLMDKPKKLDFFYLFDFL